MKINRKAKKVAAAAQTLALLGRQRALLRAELSRLEGEVLAAQQVLISTLPVEIVKANENLLLAALRSETLADTAFHELEDLTRASQHDALTGTPNRALMQDRMESAVAMAHRNGTSLAVIFVDLDHFKSINDTLGHTVGDEVLTMMARRLEVAVRDSDTVSRHGGDEFLVLLSQVAHPAHAAIIATKILASMVEPWDTNGNVLRVSGSLGIALYPKDGQDVPTLICQADSAMYRAKKAGGAQFEFVGLGYGKALNAEPDNPDAPAISNTLHTPEDANGQHRSDPAQQLLLHGMKPGSQDLRVRERRKESNHDRRAGAALSARRVSQSPGLSAP